MTLPDSPESEPGDETHRKVSMWLSGITAVAGLIAAIAAVISAVRG
jgi:hypothetical protein